MNNNQPKEEKNVTEDTNTETGSNNGHTLDKVLDRKIDFSLIDEWEELSDKLSNQEFNLEDFKNLFVKTANLISEYIFNDILPIEIPSLLMVINNYFCPTRHICINSLVAQNLAYYLTRIENRCNLEKDEINNKLYIYVMGDTTIFKLDINNLDLTELIADTSFYW